MPDATPLKEPAVTPLKDDLLTGAEQIADFTGWPIRKVYYAAARGHLPVRRIGHVLVARKTELSKELSARRDGGQAA